MVEKVTSLCFSERGTQFLSPGQEGQHLATVQVLPKTGTSECGKSWKGYTFCSVF